MGCSPVFTKSSFVLKRLKRFWRRKSYAKNALSWRHDERKTIRRIAWEVTYARGKNNCNTATWKTVKNLLSSQRHIFVFFVNSCPRVLCFLTNSNHTSKFVPSFWIWIKKARSLNLENFDLWNWNLQDSEYTDAGLWKSKSKKFGPCIQNLDKPLSMQILPRLGCYSIDSLTLNFSLQTPS